MVNACIPSIAITTRVVGGTREGTHAARSGWPFKCRRYPQLGLNGYNYGNAHNTTAQAVKLDRAERGGGIVHTLALHRAGVCERACLAKAGGRRVPFATTLVPTRAYLNVCVCRRNTNCVLWNQTFNIYSRVNCFPNMAPTASTRISARMIRAMFHACIFTDESRPILAETLVLNGTSDNGTAGATLNQAVLGFLQG